MNFNIGGYGFTINFDPTNLFQVGFYENQEQDPAQQNQEQNQVQNGPGRLVEIVEAFKGDDAVQDIVAHVLDDPEFLNNPRGYVNAWGTMPTTGSTWCDNASAALWRISELLSLNVPTYWPAMDTDTIVLKVLDEPEYQANPEAYLDKWSRALDEHNTMLHTSRPEEDAAICQLRVMLKESQNQLDALLDDPTCDPPSAVVARVLEDPAFQKSPEAYMKKWERRRGACGYREVERDARLLIEKCMNNPTKWSRMAHADLIEKVSQAPGYKQNPVAYIKIWMCMRGNDPQFRFGQDGVLAYFARMHGIELT